MTLISKTFISVLFAWLAIVLAFTSHVSQARDRGLAVYIGGGGVSLSSGLDGGGAISPRLSFGSCITYGEDRNFGYRFSVDYVRIAAKPDSNFTSGFTSNSFIFTAVGTYNNVGPSVGFGPALGIHFADHLSLGQNKSLWPITPGLTFDIKVPSETAKNMGLMVYGKGWALFSQSGVALVGAAAGIGWEF